MAAPVLRTVLKGLTAALQPRVHALRPAPCAWWRLQAAAGRALHVPSTASANSGGLKATEHKEHKAEGHKDERIAEEEEDEEGPEYIPRRKAKNPMTKIGYAWMIGMPTGIITFILAKRQVDKNRLKQLKIRQRMKRSNEGEYEGSRFHSQMDVKVQR